LSFVGASDGYQLRHGRHGGGDWEKVGHGHEKVSFNDYMSYQEIKLAAFLQASSVVIPINS